MLGFVTSALLGSLVICTPNTIQEEEKPQADPAPDLAGTNWVGSADTPVAVSFIALEFPADGADQVRLTMPSALALGKLVDVGGEPGAPTIDLSAGGLTARLHLEPSSDQITG